MELVDYLRLKKDIDRLRQRAAQARGALEQILGQLQEEYNISDRKEAEKEVQQLRKKLARLDSVFTTAVEKWQKRWEDKI